MVLHVYTGLRLAVVRQLAGGGPRPRLPIERGLQGEVAGVVHVPVPAGLVENDAAEVFLGRQLEGERAGKLGPVSGVPAALARLQAAVHGVRSGVFLAELRIGAHLRAVRRPRDVDQRGLPGRHRSTGRQSAHRQHRQHPQVSPHHGAESSTGFSGRSNMPCSDRNGASRPPTRPRVTPAGNLQSAIHPVPLCSSRPACPPAAEGGAIPRDRQAPRSAFARAVPRLRRCRRQCRSVA